MDNHELFQAFLALSKPRCEVGAIVQAVPLPAPRCGDIAIRTATMADLPFIDSLQKMHSHMVGFFPKKQMEKYIEGEDVLIAEGTEASEDQGIKGAVPGCPDASMSVGYIIFRDQYLKRDDVGIIYQLNVLPLKQRNLIGAALVKAAFERAAWGCRLFSCWCAQDIQANWFWESIGFVPIAFRTGSRSKQRTHIFWQKRVHAGDEVTGYWYPYQTQGGAVGEGRLVLPIPPGVHWRDAKPLVLPGVPGVPGVAGGAAEESESEQEVAKALPGGAPVVPRPEETMAAGADDDNGGGRAQEDPAAAAEKARRKRAHRMQVFRSRSKHLKGCPPGQAAVFSAAGVKYIDRSDYVGPEEGACDGDDDAAGAARIQAEKEKAAKKLRESRRRQAAKMKHDPKHVAAARELRDRFLDEVNSGRMMMMLPLEQCGGKYDVSRALEEAPSAMKVQPVQVRLLDAA